MRKTLIILAASISLAACTKEQAVAPEAPKTVIVENDTIIPEKAGLTIGVMQGFPKEIEGCSCYFGKTKEDLSAEKLVYADDYGKFAIININGKNEKFTLSKNETVSEDKLHKEMKNERYTVTLDAAIIPDPTYKEEGNELWGYEGEMKITDRSGNTQTVKLVGECGC